uniref:Secreted protein n=1 Tax=Panagrellus redivivus TaxID=6233 RepID=A0A7E4ZRJ3_PANRE
MLIPATFVLIGITVTAAYKGIPDSEDKAVVFEKDEYSCLSQKTLPQNFTFVNTWAGRPALRVLSEDSFNCPNDFLFGLTRNLNRFEMMIWLFSDRTSYRVREACNKYSSYFSLFYIISSPKTPQNCKNIEIWPLSYHNLPQLVTPNVPRTAPGASMHAAPTTQKTKRGSKHPHRSNDGINAEATSKYGGIPEKMPASSNAVTAPRLTKGNRPSMMLPPLPQQSAVLEKAPQTRRMDIRRSAEKPNTSDKKKKRKSKTVKQKNNPSGGMPAAPNRISPEPIKTTVKEVKAASATQIANGKRKQTSSREKFKGRLSGKLGGDVASDDREKRVRGPQPKPKVSSSSCDVCNDSDRDVESHKPQKKKKNANMLKAAASDAAIAASALPSQVASEDNETLASVDADMPELALPNYCLPEGEFEDPAPMEGSSKRARH